MYIYRRVLLNVCWPCIHRLARILQHLRAVMGISTAPFIGPLDGRDDLGAHCFVDLVFAAVRKANYSAVTPITTGCAHSSSTNPPMPRPRRVARPVHERGA